MPRLPESFSIRKAHQAQSCLSKKLILQDMLPTKIRTVAGIDVGYVGELGIGAAAVLEYESLELVESCVAVCQVKMPYVPTLLSFREVTPALAAVKKLQIEPDLFLIDAQGYAHPYRCGFASHIGLALKKPTIGAAKSRLTGTPIEIEDRTVLVDGGEVVGEVVTTKKGAKSVYVSIGHMISLESAVKIVKYCSKSRIPEPLLWAHKRATAERKRLVGAKQISKQT